MSTVLELSVVRSGIAELCLEKQQWQMLHICSYLQTL